jgi:hypothetical protein
VRGGARGWVVAWSLLALAAAPALSPESQVSAQAQAGSAGTPPPADTLRTRADSIRDRVLERIRQQSAPPPEVPDTTEVDPDGAPVRAAEPGAAPAPFVSGGPGATRNGAAQPLALPSRADSVMRALASLPGYTPAVFEGLRAVYVSADRALTLHGRPAAADQEGIPARFAGQGVRLEADSSIVYDDLSGRVRTRGSTLLTPDRGDPVRSQSLVYDVNAARGSALGAETTYAEGGGEWIVRGDLCSVEDGRVYGCGTRFTTDDRPEPNSYFEASELKVVANQILVARSVRLHFADVPVLWLPFMAQPLQSGRQSGILTPRFSVNDIVRTSGGYERRISNVGFYWAMSDYSDATLAADWWSGQYTAMTGSLRYRWARRFLQGELSGRRFWRETGARDFALSTRNSWEMTERRRINVSGNYVSNTGLVRQNSLDPREQISSINSQAALQQRFDWGSVSLEARRQQFLTDDRLQMTLPSATLTINSFTILPAAPTQASWYNNITAGATSSYRREVQEFPGDPGRAFQFGQANNVRTQASGRANLSAGNLSLGANADYRESLFADVPDYLGRPRDPFPIVQPGDVLDPLQRDLVEYSDAQINWTASLSYQQRLIGTSSITPSVSLGGQLLRVDSIAAARTFVQGPSRVSVGVGAQTELYGFYPGFGQFDAIRHKISPSMSYSYAPAVTPTLLQEQVFGSRALGVQSAVSVTLNQTFEARVEEREPAARAAPGVAVAVPADAVLPVPTDADVDRATDDEDRLPLSGDEIPAGGEPAPGGEGDTTRASALDDDGLRRPPPSRVMTLLALSTQAVSYDLVRADSTGRWIDGFTTQQVRNSVRSDFLRGLDFSFTHDLFEEPSETVPQRRFSPHLSQLSLGFQLDDQSAPVRLLGRMLGLEMEARAPTAGPADAPADDMDMLDPSDGFNDDRVLPGMSGRTPRTSMRRDGWNARLAYSLRRPRENQVGSGSQMVNGTVSFAPTSLLGVSWTTGYDVDARSFTDHMISVQRDMYDWEATFGFRQSVNGNWLFRFEVSLKANRDLKFDHETRNLEGAAGAGIIPGGPGF